MRSFHSAFAVALLLLCSVPTLPQQTSPTVQRDPRAETVLRQAISAMGGEVSWSQVTDAVAAGSMQKFVGNAPKAANFVWKVSGSEFRYELQSPDGTNIFHSGHGHPAQIRASQATPIFAHVAQANPPFHLPALVLLREVNNPQYSLAFVGTETFAGRPVIRIRASLNDDVVSSLVTPQEWLLDLASGLPLRVEYRIPSNSNAGDFETGATEFSDFRTVSGLAAPFSIVTYVRNSKALVAVVDSVAFNVGISPTEFDPPLGGGP